MKFFRISVAMLAGVAILASAGCGSESTVSSQEEQAFKNPNKGAIKPPPPGAMKPAADFKSSLGGENHAPPQSAPGAGQ